TWLWMAAKLIMVDPGQSVIHNSLHDLVSFFYMLVGICIILKTLTIQSNLTWFPKVVKHISPYFQPVISLLNNLQNDIILPMFTDKEGNFHCRTPFDHDTII
ncbi:hypothetical protein V8E55_006395, partial [Tylopilus felleus]